jgi:hypothetical protein
MIFEFEVVPDARAERRPAVGERRRLDARQRADAFERSRPEFRAAAIARVALARK